MKCICTALHYVTHAFNGTLWNGTEPIIQKIDENLFKFSFSLSTHESENLEESKGIHWTSENAAVRSIKSGDLVNDRPDRPEHTVTGCMAKYARHTHTIGRLTFCCLLPKETETEAETQTDFATSCSKYVFMSSLSLVCHFHASHAHSRHSQSHKMR